MLGSPQQTVHAVRDGIVKAILTTGGANYWRMAIAYNNLSMMLYRTYMEVYREWFLRSSLLEVVDSQYLVHTRMLLNGVISILMDPKIAYPYSNPF